MQNKKVTVKNKSQSSSPPPHSKQFEITNLSYDRGKGRNSVDLSVKDKDNKKSEIELIGDEIIENAKVVKNGKNIKNVKNMTDV